MPRSLALERAGWMRLAPEGKQPNYVRGCMIEGGTVEVAFNCPCSADNEVGAIEILGPNLMGDNAPDSDNYGDRSEVNCSKCNRLVSIGTISGQGGVFIEVEGVKPHDAYYRNIEATPQEDESDQPQEEVVAQEPDADE